MVSSCLSQPVSFSQFFHIISSYSVNHIHLQTSFTKVKSHWRPTAERNSKYLTVLSVHCMPLPCQKGQRGVRSGAVSNELWSYRSGCWYLACDWRWVKWSGAGSIDSRSFSWARTKDCLLKWPQTSNVTITANWTGEPSRCSGNQNQIISCSGFQFPRLVLISRGSQIGWSPQLRTCSTSNHWRVVDPNQHRTKSTRPRAQAFLFVTRTPCQGSWFLTTCWYMWRG